MANRFLNRPRCCFPWPAAGEGLKGPSFSSSTSRVKRERKISLTSFFSRLATLIYIIYRGSSSFYLGDLGLKQSRGAVKDWKASESHQLVHYPGGRRSREVRGGAATTAWLCSPLAGETECLQKYIMGFLDAVASLGMVGPV